MVNKHNMDAIDTHMNKKIICSPNVDRGKYIAYQLLILFGNKSSFDQEICQLNL